MPFLKMPFLKCEVTGCQLRQQRPTASDPGLPLCSEHFTIWRRSTDGSDAAWLGLMRGEFDHGKVMPDSINGSASVAEEKPPEIRPAPPEKCNCHVILVDPARGKVLRQCTLNAAHKGSHIFNAVICDEADVRAEQEGTDAELTAMRAAHAALKGLYPAQRYRVLRWLNDALKEPNS